MRYRQGDILRAAYPGPIDGTPKMRPVLFWRTHPADTGRLLVSYITRTKSNDNQWEQVLYPGARSGITDECVVKLDETRYISESIVFKRLGALDSAELQAARDLMTNYARFKKEQSAEDFNEDPFDVFRDSQPIKK
ncbi:hypothetical protein FACS1894167_04790 [Synergistales bacterium]|nr:hypothetical protein FACS1894167_04790 [Synergistales bacterium]